MKNNFMSLNTDFVGFCSSVLCAVHCGFIPILASLLPLTGLQFLTHPMVEYSLILISIIIAMFSLVRGYTRYHKEPLPLVVVGYGFLFIVLGRFAQADWQEVLFSCIGAISIAASHMLNWTRIKVNTIKS